MKKRYIYLDLLRIMAILMVMFNHTGTKGFMLFTERLNTIYYYPLLIVSIFIKIAVPIFFMISGATLIKKEETLNELYTNRVLKYSITLIVFSFIHYLWLIDWNISNINIPYFIQTIYSSGIADAYWFLYSYLAYLIMLPIIRKLAKSMKEKDYHYLIYTYLFINILRIIDWLLFKGNITLQKDFYLLNEIQYFFYPLIGHYIHNEISEKYTDKKHITIYVILSILSLVITALLTTYRCTYLNDYIEASAQYFFNSLIFIPTITTFIIFKKYLNKETKIYNIIRTLSSCTFGVMLLEHILRKTTKEVYYILLPFLNSFLSCIIWILFTYIVTTLIVFILKKISLINKLL